MKFAFWRTGCFGVMVSLAGCAGVPQLYSSKVPLGFTMAPKVQDIVRSLTCELTKVSAGKLAKKDYLITATLTLQVNDELNFSPTLSFVDPLRVAQTSRAFNENLGIGGARERNFSSIFYFSSAELAQKKACPEQGDKLYKLSGNLGLDEIVRDGIGIRDEQLVTSHLLPPNEASFASQVKFVVTKSVGALGPTWSLLTFKGPGGASGPINGKSFKTDTLIVAFSPRKLGKTLAEIQLEVTKAILKRLEDRAQEAKLAAAQKKAQADLVKSLYSAKLNMPRLGGQARFQIERANGQAEDAALESSQAQREVQRVRDELEVLEEAARQSRIRITEDALDANKNLTNTLLLQNLNIQPR